jgi:hypothetical protein
LLFPWEVLRISAPLKSATIYSDRAQPHIKTGNVSCKHRTYAADLRDIRIKYRIVLRLLRPESFQWSFIARPPRGNFFYHIFFVSPGDGNFKQRRNRHCISLKSDALDDPLAVAICLLCA